MARLFISYSSCNKHFVKRLIAHLICEGFPVWFDSLEIEPGDSLLDKIYGGIRASDFLLAILTPEYLHSDWCNDELKAARMKEKNEKRKFIIPILADGVTVPDVLADRIYVEFESSFTEGHAKLCGYLRQLEISDEHDLRPIVPLVFDDGTELDRNLLERRVSGLALHLDYPQLTESDIWDVQDPYYEAMRRLLFRVADGTAEARVSSRHDARGAAQAVVKCEEGLRRGIARIVTRARSFPGELAGLSEAAYWFGRAARWEMLAYFGLCGAAGADAPFMYPVGSCELSPFGTNKQLQAFYGIREEATLAVWDKNSDISIHVDVDRRLPLVDLLQTYRGYPEPLKEHWADIAYKYLLPVQMFRAEIRGARQTTILWEPPEGYSVSFA